MAAHQWHPGERTIREKLALDKVAGLATAYTWIQGEMPDQHSRFYTSNLHFLPVVTLDDNDRPWTSVLAGKGGEIGWVRAGSRRYDTLVMTPKVWEGDPFWENSRAFNSVGSVGDKAEEDVKERRRRRTLIAGVGVEVSTRRRNKFAGQVVKCTRDQSLREVQMDVEVSEAIGNCPKYIVLRSVSPYPQSNPTVLESHPHLSPDQRLSDQAIRFIQSADTIWLGTAYLPSDATLASEPLSPAHLGVNHRGGRPGFVRVQLSDQRTLVIPDFFGNRLMTSLGNIEATPRAAVTIADFATGDVLYLTGEARNLVGEEAERVMPFQSVLTTLWVTGYTFVADTLPVRQTPTGPGGGVEISPYSPPVKLLREELEAKGLAIVKPAMGGEAARALLKRIKLLSSTFAVFTFAFPQALTHVDRSVKPGQHVILDWRSFLGERQYRHMSEGRPSLVNDDFIRTWTISSCHTPGPGIGSSEGTTGAAAVAAAVGSETGEEFEVTMRLKPGGTVTGALFNMAAKLAIARPELLEDMSPLGIQPGLVGISGDFYLDQTMMGRTRTRNSKLLLWAAAGIGITPFLAMLRAIASAHEAVEGDGGDGGGVGEPGEGQPSPTSEWDVVLLLSTREPEVLVPLILEAIGGGRHQQSDTLKMDIHLFSTNARALTEEEFQPDLPVNVTVQRWNGRRLAPEWFVESADKSIKGLREREVFVCGTEGYEAVVLDGLERLGIAKENVRREGFVY